MSSNNLPFQKKNTIPMTLLRATKIKQFRRMIDQLQVFCLQ